MKNRFFIYEKNIYLITGMTCHAFNKIEQFCVVGVPIRFYKDLKEAREAKGTHIYPLEEVEEIDNINTLELLEILYGKS